MDFSVPVTMVAAYLVGSLDFAVVVARARGLDLYDDVQVLANGYLADVEAEDGSSFQLVANPVQFDEAELCLGPAPEHGQHTEQVLLDVLGLSWDEIAEHKQSKAIL